MEDLAFVLLAVVVVGSAIVTVSITNVLHAAVAFMGSLLGIAGICLLLQQEFIALMQVMVYVGGLVIFVVYTILLTSRLGEPAPGPHRLRLIKALAAAFAVLVTVHLATRGQVDGPQGAGPDLAAIGERLLDPAPGGYLLPFEIVSVLLLAVLIGAATIAQRSADQTADDEGQP